MFGFPFEFQGDRKWFSWCGRKAEAPLFSMESWCCEFVGNTSLRRDVRHWRGHLFLLSRQSRHSPLYEWWEAYRQNNPQLAWHPSQLREQHPRLLEKIPLQQLLVTFLKLDHWKQHQCHRVWISGRSPQNVSFYFLLFGRVWYHGAWGTLSLSVVYHLRFWSDPFPYHRRATYPSLEMVTKTWAHLSQCGFQHPRIWRSQVLCECRS